MTIYDVVNYGSRIGSGLPGAGIAQGALFAVVGANLGPAQPVQATFPLPTTDGLGGVTITIAASDGSTINGIMVYATLNEVDAILPSSTALGAATVTVNNGGTTASFPFNVVQTAFGIFTGAGVYNVNPDGSTTLNAPGQSAQPEQTILINGTGLGAIPSDETQPGVTDVPNATITVWVGTTQATVVSAGRGTCCSGIDPNFPIPQGIAAWDVIAVVIPDGTAGCQVAVSVQSGNIVSNAALIAVAPGGGTCPEALLVNNGTPVLVSGVVNTGLIDMTHIVTGQSIGGLSLTSTVASAGATFYPANFGPNPVPLPSYPADLKASVGSCWVTSSRYDSSIPVVPPPPSTTPPPTPPTPLDAGPQLNITAPNVTQAMIQQNGLYSAGTVITSIVIPGLPSSTTGGPDFLVPGPYTLDNGSGGADIGPFVANLVNPTPVNWTNMPSGGNAIDTTQGVTLTWTGGDPDGVVAITGSSSALQGTVSYSGFFYCYALAAAGQFSVPSFITEQLPPTGTPATGGIAVLQIDAVIDNLLTNIPGFAYVAYFSQQAVGAAVVFQ
jgi:uncharacterized protein (TIGR03437 family)